ncbi:MAG TPA: leucyl aminopeptidase [Longimicrobiales bacterium]|nr:leucyl aminopeptidase [Longimicrobiales bacterium]
MTMPDLQVVVSTTTAAGPMLAVFLPENGSIAQAALEAVDDRVGGVIGATVQRGDFRGRDDDVAVLYPRDADGPVQRVLVAGLGKPGDITEERVRRAVGRSVRQAEKLHVDAIGFVTAQIAAVTGITEARLAHVIAEAAVMAAWDYRELRTAPDADAGVVTSITLFAGEPAAGTVRASAEAGGIVGRAANFARDLAIRPGNVATPSYLAEAATTLADRFGMNLTVLDRQAIQTEGMHALLAVAAGSEEEPRFIVLEYHGGPTDQAPLVLIGKGVTFDSGGISIKPADRMEDMKFDMSGAAGALGAMQGIAELGLRVNVVALVPSTENLLSGKAVKPGDVIGSHLGKSIEVINTDAEGRLILVDALSYARRFEPAAILDAATLTGAVVIGLGHHAIGLMGNDDDLIDEVRNAGAVAGERCWPLPLWTEYRKQLDSVVADIRNTGGRPAGSITAGWFLREFAGDGPWAHLDIAGTAYSDEPAPYLRKGPTGVPTRLFIEWVRSRSAA